MYSALHIHLGMRHVYGRAETGGDDDDSASMGQGTMAQRTRGTRGMVTPCLRRVLGARGVMSDSMDYSSTWELRYW